MFAAGGSMARFALLLAVVGCTAGDRLVALGEPGPKLVVSQAHQSFGEVPVGSSATATVRVSNNGLAPSASLAPTLNGDAVFALDGTCASDALAPGASCDLRVTFAPAVTGPAGATVAIAGPLAVAVDGYGLPRPAPH